MADRGIGNEISSAILFTEIIAVVSSLNAQNVILQNISAALTRLATKVDKMAGDITSILADDAAIVAAVNTLSTNVTAIVTDLADVSAALKALASGGGATPAQLTQIDTDLNASLTQLNNANNALTAGVAANPDPGAPAPATPPSTPTT